MSSILLDPPDELPESPRSTAGGSAQRLENAFGRLPEPLEDADQVFDSDSATVDRVARNPGDPLTERRGYRIRRFLANLMK
jgi:hypothetical protein